jgi:hypothetical protein
MSEVIESVRATAWKAEMRLRRRKGGGHAAFAEITIEFQCRMRPHWNGHRRKADILLKMGRPRFPWIDRRAVHRVRIVCRRIGAWEPRLYVNGKFETFASALAGLTNPHKEGEKT